MDHVRQSCLGLGVSVFPVLFIVVSKRRMPWSSFTTCGPPSDLITVEECVSKSKLRGFLIAAEGDAVIELVIEPHHSGRFFLFH